MSFIPHDENSMKEMMDELGIKSLDELFSHIPPDNFSKDGIRLPQGKSEPETVREIEEILSKNTHLKEYSAVFTGGGVYYHYIPEAVGYISLLPGFITPYTPYQPEANQGILTATFEYQTLICELTGMDISNASIYDGSTASAEAVLMGLRVGRGNKVFISSGVNPLYREVIKTYLWAKNYRILELPLNERGETLFEEGLMEKMEEGDVCVIQSPNFYGIIEDMESCAKYIKEKKGIAVHIFTEALSLAVLKTPGESNFDISAGEGQSFGIPPSFGGPLLGILTSKSYCLRQMPGRIAGQTKDLEGRRGFVFTLSTREQHIRREKATSNICTNVQLNVIRCAAYLSLMGASLIKLAQENLKRSHYLFNLLKNSRKFHFPFKGEFFNEFVVRLPFRAKEVRDKLLDEKILAGIPLEEVDPSHDGRDLLITVTEMNSRTSLEKFSQALERVCR